MVGMLEVGDLLGLRLVSFRVRHVAVSSVVARARLVIVVTVFDLIV